MKTSHSNKGFTLVEIMIVVVIIGLLAAMAIPAFKKVRESSIEKTVLNDGRMLGAAAQQYFMENGVTTVSCSFDAAGTQLGNLSVYCTRISSKNTFTGQTGGQIAVGEQFTLANSGLVVGATASQPVGKRIFNAEGALIP